MPANKRPFRIGDGFERLEDRSVPTAFGIPWPDARNLSLSFVPDNTAGPTGPSSLSSTLSGTPGWQREVLRAYQSWAVNGNMNIGVVADGGQPLGTVGAVQGDRRFGDVRVGAVPGGGEHEAANAAPFHWIGSTYSGDMTFDNTEAYRIGPGAAGYNIYSVAVHEAGHSFGLGHSDAAGSVMNETYSDHTGLSAADIAAFRELYGTRTPDVYDRLIDNNTPARATPILATGLLGLRLTADGDLTTLGDVDYYRLVTPILGIGAFSVKVKTEGKSLLLPKVAVLDNSGRAVAADLSTDPLNNDVTVTVRNPRLGQSYVVMVDNATNDAFGIGSYQLIVDHLLFGGSPPADPVTPPVRDFHLNDALLLATPLLPAAGGFDFLTKATIEDGWDVDSYLVPSLNLGGGDVNLNVLVWGEVGGLTPKVKVFDLLHRPVPYQVLANDAGLTSIVVEDVAPLGVYYVQVSGRTAGANGTGAYTLAADFNTLPATTLSGAAAGRVAADWGSTGGLTVNAGGAYHFALAASEGTGSVGLQVKNAAGNTVLAFSSAANQPMTTRTTYLAAGQYTISYTYSGGSSAPLRYDLYLEQMTDEVGPRGTSTTKGTSPPPPPPPPPYSYTGSSESTKSLPYYF